MCVCVCVCVCMCPWNLCPHINSRLWVSSPALLWESVSGMAPFLKAHALLHNESVYTWRGAHPRGLVMSYDLALSTPEPSSPSLPALRQCFLSPTLGSRPLPLVWLPPYPASRQLSSTEESFRSGGGRSRPAGKAFIP